MLSRSWLRKVVEIKWDRTSKWGTLVCKVAEDCWVEPSTLEWIGLLIKRPVKKRRKMVGKRTLEMIWNEVESLTYLEMYRLHRKLNEFTEQGEKGSYSMEIYCQTCARPWFRSQTCARLLRKLSKRQGLRHEIPQSTYERKARYKLDRKEYDRRYRLFGNNTGGHKEGWEDQRA